MRADIASAGRLLLTLAAAQLAGLSLVVSLPALAATSSAPDVVVYTEPTLQPALSTIGRAYRAKTGNPVRIFAAPSSMLLGEIPHTRDDVMVLQTLANATAAVARKIAAPAPPIALGRNHLAVARRGGGGEQPLSNLPPTGAIAIVDLAMPDQLGALAHAALDATAWPPKDAHVIGVARGADAAFLLDTGEASYAVLYRTDIAAEPGLAPAASLPDPSTPIEYFALASADASSPNTQDFLSFLGGAEAQKMFDQAGLTAPAP